MQSKTLLSISVLCLLSCRTNMGKNTSSSLPAAASAQANSWLTKGDQTALLEKQATALSFGTVANANPTIFINAAQQFQAIDGFGFALTGGSAALIHRLSPAERSTLLQELFGHATNSISISYLRISIGASDLDSAVFSYDDLPAGETDTALRHFTLDPDRKDLIPLLKEILKVNPNLKILSSPWSAPVWMKNNGSSKGGSLKPEYYSIYANYFVKYIQQMRAEGIAIDAITPQNEPLHPGNNPSLYMTAEQQADFIKNYLGPAFKAAGITTKILVYDHNCDRPDYPLTILNDPAAKPFVDGSAFHLYAGDISVLSQVHNAHPDKHLYFTEQWTGAKENFADNLRWHVRNVVIGSVRNWSRVALEWNLASDPSYHPHTPGGCTECKGALTIGTGIKRNESYYIIGHASKFVPPGSIRIGSNTSLDLYNAAFKTPDGKIVVIVVNDGAKDVTFNIRFQGKWITPMLPAGAVATYVW